MISQVELCLDDLSQGTLEEEYSTMSAVPADARQSTQSNGSKENASISLAQGTLEDGYLTAASSLSDVGESEQSSGIKESPAKSSSEDTLEEGCSVTTSALYDVSKSDESSGIKEKPDEGTFARRFCKASLLLQTQRHYLCRSRALPMPKSR